MAWSRAFQSCLFNHFVQIFFANIHTSYFITGFCNKKYNFCKFANILADSKSRAQEVSNDVQGVPKNMGVQ